MQLIPGTTLGHQVAAACAEIKGASIEEHVMARSCAQRRLESKSQSCSAIRGYMYGVAYSFRNESNIFPLDVTYDPKSTAIPRTR